MKAKTKRVRAIASGRVQGVWFRARTRDEALRLGVSGYVRNLPDGTVEIEAQGDEEDVDALMRWARRGPSLAEVSDLRVTEILDDASHGTFEIRY